MMNCPKCGSDDVGWLGNNIWWGVTEGFEVYYYHCNSCHEGWEFPLYDTRCLNGTLIYKEE